MDKMNEVKDTVEATAAALAEIQAEDDSARLSPEQVAEAIASQVSQILDKDTDDS